MTSCQSDRTYVEGVFSLLAQVTKDFPLSQGKNEPKELSAEEMRLFRLKKLVTAARRLAMEKFREMPEVFHGVHTEDDWIQDALAILVEESLRYTPREGYTYDAYMARFLIPRRLTGLQRSLLRKNPPVGEALRRAVHILEKSLRSKAPHRRPTPEEIADFTGVGIEEAGQFLETGAGPRIFRHAGEDVALENRSEEDAGRARSCPETACLHKESMTIVLDCLEILKPFDRWLVMQHVIDGVSFIRLAELTGKTAEAVRNRCRRGLKRVRECIEGRYGDTSPL